MRKWSKEGQKKEKRKTCEVKIMPLEASKSDVIIVVLAPKNRKTFPLASRRSIINFKKIAGGATNSTKHTLPASRLYTLKYTLFGPLRTVF